MCNGCLRVTIGYIIQKNGPQLFFVLNKIKKVPEVVISYHECVVLLKNHKCNFRGELKSGGDVKYQRASDPCLNSNYTISKINSPHNQDFYDLGVIQRNCIINTVKKKAVDGISRCVANNFHSPLKN